jgi:hypothetical protein
VFFCLEGPPGGIAVKEAHHHEQHRQIQTVGARSRVINKPATKVQGRHHSRRSVWALRAWDSGDRAETVIVGELAGCFVVKVKAGQCRGLTGNIAKLPDLLGSELSHSSDGGH